MPDYPPVYQPDYTEFYSRFAMLCKDRGVSPSAAVEAIGLNKANASFWKRGSLPSSKNLQKLSEFFNVPVGFLLDPGSDLESFPWLLDGPDADIPEWLLHDEGGLKKALARAQNQLSLAERARSQPGIEYWNAECTFVIKLIEKASTEKHTDLTDRTKLLLSIFEQLNDTGQEKAIEWISEIRKIPSYQHKD